MQKDDLQFTESYEQQNKESEKKKCFKQYYAKHVDKKKQQAKNSYMKNKEKRKEYFKRQYLKRKADSETFHKIKQHVKNSYEKSKETKKEYFKQQYLKQKTCGKLKTKQKNTTNIQSDTEDVQLDSAKAYSLSDDNLLNFVSYVDAEAKQKKRQRRTCSKIDF